MRKHDLGILENLLTAAIKRNSKGRSQQRTPYPS